MNKSIHNGLFSPNRTLNLVIAHVKIQFNSRESDQINSYLNNKNTMNKSIHNETSSPALALVPVVAQVKIQFTPSAANEKSNFLEFFKRSQLIF
ncbi:hypothetical protein [Bizionia paragorgiae]|uniref:hypothetical protein n=1 Tax=Bizionia paragorgiae TaxID=283786 RepID=UPI003A8D2F54